MSLVLSRLEKGSEPKSTPRSGLDTSLAFNVLPFGLELDLFLGEAGISPDA